MLLHTLQFSTIEVNKKKHTSTWAQIDLDQCECKTSQDNTSAHKPWPNKVISSRKLETCVYLRLFGQDLKWIAGTFYKGSTITQTTNDMEVKGLSSVHDNTTSLYR